MFAACMTGNLAFLGMLVAGSAEAPSFTNLVVSLGSFAAGAYRGARLATDGRPSAPTVHVLLGV